MNRMASTLLSLVAVTLLGGCENDAASYRIDDSGEHALTLIREQRYFWDRYSDVALVVAHRPECQRRHPLNPTPVKEAHAELYRAGRDGLLLKNGGQWYGVATSLCGVYKIEAPTETARGTLLGTFDNPGDGLRFIAAEAPRK